MEKSKIKNPAIKEIWDRSIWTGQPESSAIAAECMLSVTFVGIFLALLFAASELTKMIDVAIVFAGFGVLFVLLLIPFFKVIRTFRWKNPKLMFAVVDGCIFFTGEDSAKSTAPSSWFYESLTNVSSFSRKINGEKTTVILNFIEKSNAGIYGNLKALPLYRISNSQQLISTLKGLGIQEQAKK
jgi:hypothetical protein